MFLVLDSDRQVRGPFTMDELRRQWAAGQLSDRAQVRPQESPDWKPLIEYPEIRQTPRATPPPLPSAPVIASGPSASKTSGLAISSFVLGLFGIFGITALIGFILGLVALGRIRRSQGHLRGRGLAVAGIIASTLMLIGLATAAIAIPFFIRAVQQARMQQDFNFSQGWSPDPAHCVRTMQDLAAAMQRYCAGAKQQFPPANEWCDEVQVFVPNLGALRCRGDGSNARCSYGFNSRLSGLPCNQVAPRTVIFFEQRSGWNRHGGRKDMISRHHNTYVVAFADGTVEQLPADRLNELRWEP